MSNSQASDLTISSLRELLGEWEKENRRDFLWRYSKNPYIVLVSEFMLHRTQVSQVNPIFRSFTNLYPTLANYVQASKNEVEVLLQPLGLHWRITGMLNALDIIYEKYGDVPADYEKLFAIHGIGQYIAGATVCFVTNTPYILVDSNIIRVIGRFNGFDLSGEARRKREIIDAIAYSMDTNNPREFYYAIIDLAHILCHPKNPNCEICPIRMIPCCFGENR